MLRTATVTDVTDAGVWVQSGWLPAKTGPLPCFGAAQAGDAVLVVRSDDGELLAIGARPADGSVTSAMIVNGTIVNEDVATDAAIARSKIAGLPTTSTDNAVPRFDGSGGALQTSGVTVDDSNNVIQSGTGSLYHRILGATASMYLDASASGSWSQVMFRTNGSNRWTVYKNETAESGSGVGSDLVIGRYADNGSTYNEAVKITRATGRVTFYAVGATAGLEMGSSGPRIMAGSGAPENVVTAPIGSLWLRTNGGAGTTLYVKESGTGNTGWVAK